MPQVWGAYWENSYFKKSQCLDCNCAYSYFNLCYWYKPNPIRSCHLRINVEGKTTFEFGIGASAALFSWILNIVLIVLCFFGTFLVQPYRNV